MTMFRLALRNLTGTAFRSWVVILASMLVASVTLVTSLIVYGTETSIRLVVERLAQISLLYPRIPRLKSKVRS